MKSKTINSENEKNSKDDEDKVNSKDSESELIDLDWIFDKGWLRTKK